MCAAHARSGGLGPPMFVRLLWRLLRGSQGRLWVALVALISGGAVIAALLNLDFDAGRKLQREFRQFGANLIVAPRQARAVKPTQPGEMRLASPAALMDESALAAVQRAAPDAPVAPFLYVIASVHDTPVAVAGTWLDRMDALAPTWKVEGRTIGSRQDAGECLAGRNVARQFGLSSGSELRLRYPGKTSELKVAGIIEAGGAEDNQVFVNLPVLQRLAGLPRRISMIEIAAGGGAKRITETEANLSRALPEAEVRPIRQMTQAEGDILRRIQLLILSMAILILALTALCVLGAMSALAMERRRDVGMMKALGGSMGRIVGLFLAEAGTLGALGGLAGGLGGILLARWMGARVFDSPISARWEVVPLTIAIMTGISLAGALPLRLLGKVKPAAILRGES